jgi:hypothetical protein
MVTVYEVWRRKVLETVCLKKVRKVLKCPVIAAGPWVKIQTRDL